MSLIEDFLATLKGTNATLRLIRQLQGEISRLRGEISQINNQILDITHGLYISNELEIEEINQLYKKIDEIDLIIQEKEDQLKKLHSGGAGSSQKYPCPYCGHMVSYGMKFCADCGKPLPDQKVKLVEIPNPNPWLDNPASSIGLIGIVGGSLTTIGWLLPWFSLGSVGDILETFLPGNLSFGNGLQLLFGLVTLSLASFGDNEMAGFGILGLILAGFFLMILINGILIIKTGFEIFENRNRMENNELFLNALLIRKRSSFVWIILLIIFVIAMSIPFLASALGWGFYMTAIGAFGSYIGVRILMNRLHEPEENP